MDVYVYADCGDERCFKVMAGCICSDSPSISSLTVKNGASMSNAAASSLVH